MFLLRVVTTALCATSVVLLLIPQPVRIVTPEATPLPIPELGRCRLERVQPLTVIDVAAGVTASQLDGLLHLHAGERITAVNDHPLARGVAPATLIGPLAPAPGGYLDLTVTGDATERRVLVLLH